MNQKLNELDPQVISDIANYLNIPAYVVEKDVHVTKVLNIISKIQDDTFHIVFHGGTCLAKAYQIIKRMSEDCDFRLIFKNGENLSRSQRRIKIGLIKSVIMSELKLHGYDKVLENSYNESTASEIQITYKSIFPIESVLRKEIKLEFMVIPLLNTSNLKKVQSLVKTILADKVDGIISDVRCISLPEMAANKWVAFTRRIAISERGYKPHDSTVIRHLYDLSKLYNQGIYDQMALNLIPEIIENEKAQYGKLHKEYALDPISEIQYALDKLKTNRQWQKDWNSFIEVMLYDDEKITFKNATAGVCELSEILLACCNG